MKDLFDRYDLDHEMAGFKKRQNTNLCRKSLCSIVSKAFYWSIKINSVIIHLDQSLLEYYHLYMRGSIS